MIKVPLRVAVLDGYEHIYGWSIDEDHPLAVHRPLRDKSRKKWKVSHRETGLSIPCVKTIRLSDALIVSKELGKLIDWSEVRPGRKHGSVIGWKGENSETIKAFVSTRFLTT